MLLFIRKILNTHKIIYVLIFSYAVMLLLPFIAGIFSFCFGNNIMKEYVSETASAYAKNFSDKFDKIISDCSHAYNQIYFDEQIQELSSSINDSEDVFALRTLSAKLKTLIYTNSNISEIIVFPFGSDYVIHSGGFFDKKSYYSAYINHEVMNEEAFLKMIGDNGDSYFCIFPDEDTFSYSVNLPVSSGNSPARIFILSDCKQIFRSTLPETDNFFVCQNGEILIGSDHSQSEDMLSLIRSMTDRSIPKYTKNHIFATSMQSSVKSLTYFYTTDLKKISASQKTYMIITSVIFVITLLIGIVFFGLFVKIQYEPINNIIKYIKSHINTGNDVDSFEFINSNIGNLEKEILEQRESYLEQNNLLLSMHLSQWLRYNKIPAHPEEIFVLDEASVYVVVSITFYSPEELFFEYNPQGIEQNISIAKFIIENIFSEMLSEKSIPNKMIEFESSIAVIILFDKDSDYKSQLNKIFEEISSIVQKEFNLEPDYFCSAPYHSYDMLHHAFTESTTLLQHEKNANRDICHFYDDMDFSIETPTIRLLDCSKALFSSISGGDAAQAKSIINNMCLSINSDLSQPYARYILTCLVSSINSALSSIASINEMNIHRFIQQNAPIEQIMNNACNPIHALTRYADIVCAYINENQEKPASISQKAQKYIDENYSDSQLTSDIVANSVGLSRDYFLKLFKQQTGETMSDYLNKVRIEKACEIIKSENCVLSDVADRVGYASVKTFTRAFIKHIGITPGKYK